MVEESGQENQDVRQDTVPPESKTPLTASLGTPITVALAAFAILVGVFMLLIVAGLVWYSLPVLGFDTGFSIKERKNLAQGFASVAQALAVGLTGAAGFIGLAFTWRNLRQTAESTQRTLELTEQGQITERFTRAIDQLGQTDAGDNPRLEIRLGAIYALERIARDSPDRDYGTVMEVLTAYVRENAPWPPKNSAEPNSASGETAGETTLPNPEPVRADVQACLNVLGRRDDSVSSRVEVHLDLRNTNLFHAELIEADLSGTIFHNANLSKAMMGNAKCSNASFLYANLSKAVLTGANLSEADFLGAALYGTFINRANLKGATSLTQEQLNWTIGDAERTQLPEGLHPPPTWSRDPLEQRQIITERLVELERIISSEDPSSTDFGE